jgi:hypothetical protein
MTCIKRAEDVNDPCGCDEAILRPCGHFECHLRQCWWAHMQRPVPSVAPVPYESSTSSSSSTASQRLLPALSSSLSSTGPLPWPPAPVTLEQYLDRTEIDTLLNMIPTSESIQRLLDIPNPVSPAIALMFTKFITLMDHFFLHYSSLPCSPQCPCHREREPSGVVMDEPEQVLEEDRSESKEEKKEAKIASGTPRDLTDSAPSAMILHDKSAKFRFNWTNRSHRGAMIRLVPHVLDVFKHMGVILHGLNTCSAEQFARERYHAGLNSESESIDPSWMCCICNMQDSVDFESELIWLMACTMSGDGTSVSLSNR